MFQVEEASEGPGRKKRQWEDERKTTKITTSNSQQTEFKVNQGILKRAQSVRRRVQNNATCHTEKRAASGKISNTNNSSARGGRGWEMLDPVLRKQEGDLTRPEGAKLCFGGALGANTGAAPSTSQPPLCSPTYTAALSSSGVGKWI